MLALDSTYRDAALLLEATEVSHFGLDSHSTNGIYLDDDEDEGDDGDGDGDGAGEGGEGTAGRKVEVEHEQHAKAVVVVMGDGGDSNTNGSAAAATGLRVETQRRVKLPDGVQINKGKTVELTRANNNNNYNINTNSDWNPFHRESTESDPLLQSGGSGSGGGSSSKQNKGSLGSGNAEQQPHQQQHQQHQQQYEHHVHYRRHGKAAPVRRHYAPTVVPVVQSRGSMVIVGAVLRKDLKESLMKLNKLAEVAHSVPVSSGENAPVYMCWYSTCMHAWYPLLIRIDCVNSTVLVRWEIRNPAGLTSNIFNFILCSFR